MKKLVIVGGAVLIIIVVFLFVGLSNLGPIIKTAVNTYGPKITKTEVRLGDVDLSIFSGQAKLKEFSLGNPRGFNAPTAIDVGSIYVDVDEGSLTGEIIVIDKIAVVKPEITYEKVRGTDNFRAILSNVKKSVGSAKPSEKTPEKGGAGKKIMIRDFVLKDGKVNLAMSMFPDRTISASLPDIHLTDIGKKDQGLLPAVAFEKILEVVYKQITSPAVADRLNDGLKKLKSGVAAAREDAAKELEAAKATAEKEVQAAGDRAKEKAQKEIEKVEKEVEGLTGKVKGLLGK